METALQSNEIKIPKSNKVHQSKIDFKSSFARSLSVGGYDDNRYEASKSLDFEINFQACNVTESETAGCDKNAAKLASLDEDLVVGTFNESFNKSDEDKERQLWSKTKKQHQQIPNENFNSNDAEILRLRKECQNLIEENRRLQGKNSLKMSSLPYGSLQYECNNGVENVVLQTKVETLQWQLRQVENSRQMYRCIMEEVARYLEKCHLSFEMIQKRERDKVIERSKSIAYIAKSKTINGVTGSDGRAKSSTNLTSLSTMQTHKPARSGTLLSDISYSAFKDFTWRRSPKNKSNGVDIKPEKFTFSDRESSVDVEEVERRPSPNHEASADFDKLSKEAFRLSRTVQNFLNTHEPILSQANAPTVDVVSYQRPTLDQQRSDFLFGFDRESHLSLRSTDESSVHSSSNSSNKEEEDPTFLPKLPLNKAICIPAKVLTKSKRFSTCHQTEDESGFSSMNSFHEIGLPLHSTLISVNTSGTSSDDSQSETTKAVKRAEDELKDDVGVPIITSPKSVINHRRYDSAPVPMAHNVKMKILENEEKTMKVLWV